MPIAYELGNPAKMSSNKAALKAINDAIRNKKWDDATEQAKNIIGRDPENYQA